MEENDKETRVKYEVRPGASNPGREYEINMLTLLAIRCVRQKFHDFWLGTNVANIGDFDDVFLQVMESPKSSGFTYLIQLKHSEKPKKLNQTDFMSAQKGTSNFSLIKYSKSLSKLVPTLQKSSDDVIRRMKLDKTTFVLFTNRVSEKQKCLVKASDNWFFLLNTVNNTKNIFKFDLKILGGECLDNLDLCEKICLFSNQADVKKLDDLVIAELEELTKQMDVKKIDVKNVADKFKSFIDEWAKGELGEYFYLTKRDIVLKLSQLCLEQFLYDFKEGCWKFPADRLEIWGKLTKDKKVTLINANDEVLAFLSQHINNQLKKSFDETCPGDSKTENNPKTKDKNRSGDVYKQLAFSMQLPLVLKINNSEDFEDTLGILQFSNYKFNAVFVNNAGLLPDLNVPVKRFITLNDLNELERAVILEQSINLQGRPSSTLGKLIDESMYEFIKTQDVIHILSNTFNLGSQYREYSEFSKYFIERALSKVLLAPVVMEKLKDEIFLVEDSSNADLNRLLARTKHNYNDNVIVCKEEESMLRLEELQCKKNVIHCLRYFDSKRLEWIKTIGNIKNIRQHQVIQHQNAYKFVCNQRANNNSNPFWIELEEILNDGNENCLLNRSVVINASPGMGKTTLMDYVAFKAPLRIWVLKINLNEHKNYYKTYFKNSSAYEHLKYFNKSILEKYGCKNIELAQAAFLKFLDNRKVLVLFDAFDEIVISHQNEVIAITKCLQEQGFPVWVTTRPVMQAYLEEQFKTCSTTLKPFSIDHQKAFLFDYFKHNILGSNLEGPQLIIKGFVDKLLAAARECLNDYDCKFTGIPLQGKLLAEVFLNDCIVSIDSGEIKFKEKFDLLDLYEEFIKKKTDILCVKFGEDAECTRSLFEEHQQLFALKTLFDEKSLIELNIDRQLQKYYKDKLNKIQLLQRDGFIEVNYNPASKWKYSVNFVHRTFGEYLAAVWISINVKEEDDSLEKRTACSLMEKRFGQTGGWQYEFLFNIFDRIVCRSSQMHLSILNGQIDGVGEILKDCPERIAEVDDCGRSILHMLALHGKLHPVHGFLDWENSNDGVVRIINYVPDCTLSNINDDILGYNPLLYALACNSLSIANKICEKSNILTVEKRIDRSLRFTYCQYCIKLGYKSLFKLLLPYFASEDIFTRFVNANLTVELYCNAYNYDQAEYDCFNNYLNEMGVTVQSKISKFLPYYFDELQISVAFGSKTDVEPLLKGNVNINKEDLQRNTLLHYAVIHEQYEIMKMLLDRGADVNKPGKNKNTPLHYAAGRGNVQIVESLLYSNANVNKLNWKDETPLTLAFENRHKDVAKLLLSKGAISKSSLHFAVLTGDYKMVRQVLNNGVDVNQLNHNNDTPLLIAVRYGYKKITELLLSKGPNCDIFNTLDEFCLYWAVRKGDDDIVTKLISAGADVNKINPTYGDNLLHFAIQYKHLSTIELLLSYGVDFNLQNANGKTPLHSAIEQKFEEAAKVLLLKGAEINLQDCSGSTPLDIAIREGYEDIAQLIRFKNSAVQ